MQQHVPSVVSWREGLSLAGVLLASTLPGLVGLTPTTLVLALALAAGLALLAFPAGGRDDDDRGNRNRRMF